MYNEQNVLTIFFLILNPGSTWVVFFFLQEVNQIELKIHLEVYHQVEVEHVDWSKPINSQVHTVHARHMILVHTVLQCMYLYVYVPIYNCTFIHVCIVHIHVHVCVFCPGWSLFLFPCKFYSFFLPNPKNHVSNAIAEKDSSMKMTYKYIR